MLLVLDLKIGELVDIMAVYDNVLSRTAVLRASSQMGIIGCNFRADLHVYHLERQHPQSPCRVQLNWLRSADFDRPNIHDYDITTERPRVPEDLEGAWGKYYGGWLDFAELQGDILEQLFSARAQKEAQDVRTQHARWLGARLESLGNVFAGVSPAYRSLLAQDILSLLISPDRNRA